MAKLANLFSEKKIKALVLLFVLVFAVAVGAITMGVVLLGDKKPGYHVVEVLPENAQNTALSGATYRIYADGSSNAIKRTLQEASAVFSPALQRYCFLLDPSESHEGYVNLHTLNANPGQEFPISRDLYHVLADALTKSGDDNGYSLLDGALYTYWQSIRYLSEPEPFDPLCNDDIAQRFRTLAAFAHDPASCSLTLVDGDTPTACLSLSEEFVAYLQECDLQGTVLDLNLLKDAYLVDLLQKDLQAQGMTNGYISTASGVSFVQDREDTFFLLSDDAQPVTAAPRSSLARLSASPPAENTPGYYSLSQPEGSIPRSAFIRYATGDTVLPLASAAVAWPGTVSDACYRALCLFYSANVQDAQTAADAIQAAGGQAVYALSH